MKISKKIISIIAIFLAVSAIATMAEDNMGWLNNSSGTYEYFDTANWYDGVVNGLFSTNITSKSTQNITFSSDFDVTSDTFNFNYPGEVTFTFRGDGENDVWATVLDDIVISPKTTKGRINFGTPTEGQKINFDLGGECRTLTTTFSPLYFRNTFINGSLIVKGGGWMRLDGDDASAADVDVTAEYSTTLNYISEGEGAKRAHNLTMQSANLIVRGNSSVDSVNEITESITLDAGEMGGVNFITVEAGSRNSKLYTSEIIRRNGAIVCMRGHNFGDLPDGGVGNLFVDNVPELIGGDGVEGPTSLSVVPWIVGSRTPIGGGNATYDGTLVTYDAEHGFRPLDLETEFTNVVDIISGSWQNVRVPNATTWTLESDTTINSLILQGSDPNKTNTIVNGTGTLTVQSGVVLLGYHRNAQPRIEVPLDFGDAQGIITFPMGKASTITEPISGSGGLVFAQMSTDSNISSGGTGITLSSNAHNCTYSGDTYIHGRIFAGLNTFPSGDRKGDLYIYGICQANNASINGLNGSGVFNKPNSGGGHLTVGGNNADGDFTGSFTQSGALAITKIGSGTQRFAGISKSTGATTVDAGTLIMDGDAINPVTVNDGATFAGAGTIEKSGAAVTIKSGATLIPGNMDGFGTMTILEGNVVFEEDSSMEFKVDKAGNGAISVEENVLGDFTIPVSFSGEGPGKWLVMEAASIEPDFVSATSGVHLSLEANGTQLWAERFDPVTVITVK